MNKKASESGSLASEIVKLAESSSHVEVVVCPPYTSIAAVAESLKGSAVKLGAQDAHWEESGAFTGKISVSMLKDSGVEYIILGHSEQRIYFDETDENVNKKAKATLAANLTPIICVGETLEEREAEETKAVVKEQLNGAYAGISDEDAEKTIIAYEPIWAIGTGLTATAEQAQEIHGYIRGLLTEKFGSVSAAKVRIQYGGSMKPENAAELLSQPDIDGGLIGGASLKADSFIGIIQAVKS